MGDFLVSFPEIFKETPKGCFGWGPSCKVALSHIHENDQRPSNSQTASLYCCVNSQSAQYWAIFRVLLSQLVKICIYSSINFYWLCLCLFWGLRVNGIGQYVTPWLLWTLKIKEIFISKRANKILNLRLGTLIYLQYKLLNDLYSFCQQ